MSRPEFYLETIAPGTKGLFRLTVPFGGCLESLGEQIVLACNPLSSKAEIHSEITRWLDKGNLCLPVLAARGIDRGEMLVATGGVHGDEYEGVEAIYRVFEEIDPRGMQGSFIGVPVVNVPAFWLGVRCNPVDYKNLARVFPGAAKGSPTEQLAETLLDRVLRHASLYVDLHSAGRNYHMLTLCGYCTAGTQAARAAEAANCFGAPVIWAHPSVSPGRTVSATLDLGIPSLYTEAFGGGHASPDDVEVYTRGLSNLLQFLKITELAEAALGVQTPLRLGGSGDLDSAINCRHSGLFFSSVNLGARLKEGDTLGVLRGMDGRVLEKVRTPQDGVLVLIRATPRTFAGELVAAVANEQPS
jgi:predicted deacylase